MRSIVITVIAIFLIAVAPQIAHAKHTYIVQQWPEDMAKVPCSAVASSAVASERDMDGGGGFRSSRQPVYREYLSHRLARGWNA
jgi:hypothetical protein